MIKDVGGSLANSRLFARLKADGGMVMRGSDRGLRDRTLITSIGQSSRTVKHSVNFPAVLVNLTNVPLTLLAAFEKDPLRWMKLPHVNIHDGTTHSLEKPTVPIVVQSFSAVFLAGGIGITPFSSIVRQAEHDRAPHKLYVFYSNRRPEDAAYLESLQALERTNPNFHLIATMTEMQRSKKMWNGESDWIEQGDAVQAAKRIAWPNLLHCRASSHGYTHEKNASGMGRR